jgi:hypothetical protein
MAKLLEECEGVGPAGLTHACRQLTSKEEREALVEMTGQPT